MSHIGYISHGVGLLDPDRHIPESRCARCGSPVFGTVTIGRHEVCAECHQDVISDELKVEFAEASGREFFKWLLTEITNNPDDVRRLLKDFAKESSQDFYEWAVLGHWEGK